MTLIAVAAVKGAPGVSTAAVALALGWPRPVLLAECDPAGADLPWRLPAQDGHPLSQKVGITSLAAAARTGGATTAVWPHTQRLDGGLPVLVGPAGPSQAAAIGPGWAQVAGCLAAVAGADVLADCGRVTTTTTVVAPVLQHADLVVLVTRPTLSGVAHLRRGIGEVARLLNTAGRASRVPAVPGGPGGPGTSRGGVEEWRGSGLDRVAVLVVDDGVADRRAGAREVDEVLARAPGLADVPVLGVLAYDPRAAAALAGAGWGAGLAKSALLRSATTVAGPVLRRAGADPDATAGGPTSGATDREPGNEQGHGQGHGEGTGDPGEPGSRPGTSAAQRGRRLRVWGRS